MTETLKLWEFLIGLASMFVWFGIFYEHTRSKFREYDKAFAAYDKAFESCHIDTLMTEEKCLRYHTDRDRLVQLQIAQMQKVVEALEASQKVDDQRWGGLSEKINIIIDRMDRGTGYAK
jgi:hypothetical protein